MKNKEEKIVDKCEECMFDAPFSFCCKYECNEHEFCRGCEALSKEYRSQYENCS